MSDPICERNDIVKRGDPEEASRYIVASGGDEPPIDTDWELVFEAARKSITVFPEFDERYMFRDEVPGAHIGVVRDLLFPRTYLEQQLKRLDDLEASDV